MMIFIQFVVGIGKSQMSNLGSKYIPTTAFTNTINNLG